MLETFSFHLRQMDYVHGAMVEAPKFRPDNKTPAQVQAMKEFSGELRSNYLEKDAELKTVRAEFHRALEAGHQAAVSVYATMKSIYRKDPVAREAISKLPVDDRTSSETLTRLEAISKQWAELPNMPGTEQAFVAGETDKAAFDALHTSLKEKHATLAACEQQFKARTAALNQQDELNASFVSAAIAQGRAQFLPGTNERNLIEGIPVEAAPSSNSTSTTDDATIVQAPLADRETQIPVDFDLPQAVNQ